MKKHLNFLLLILFFSITLFSFKKDCSDKYRYSLKILSDKEASRINWIPKNTTVKYITKLIQPPLLNDKKFDKNIRYGYEYFVYEFNCKIKGYSIDDYGNYNLILSDIKDTTLTILGYIPNTDCDSVKYSKHINVFHDVMSEFNKNILEDGKVNQSTFIIIGVCFFDNNNKAGIYPIMDLIKSN